MPAPLIHSHWYYPKLDTFRSSGQAERAGSSSQERTDAHFRPARWWRGFVVDSFKPSWLIARERRIIVEIKGYGSKTLFIDDRAREPAELMLNAPRS